MDLGALSLGQGLIVELTLESAAAVENIAVTDPLPAGVEAEALERTDPALPKPGPQDLIAEHVAARRDGVTVYGSLWQGGKRRYFYGARAVRRGEFYLPPVRAEALYDPERRSVSGAGSVVVR